MRCFDNQKYFAIAIIYSGLTLLASSWTASKKRHDDVGAALWSLLFFLKVTQKLVKQHTKAFLQDSFSPETFKGVSDDLAETHKRSFIASQLFF